MVHVSVVCSSVCTEVVPLHCMLPWLHPPPSSSAEMSTFSCIAPMQQATPPRRWRSRGQQELPLVHGFPVTSSLAPSSRPEGMSPPCTSTRVVPPPVWLCWCASLLDQKRMSDIELISLSIPNLSRFLFVSAFVGLEGVTGSRTGLTVPRP